MEGSKGNSMKVLQINAIYGAKSTGIIVQDIHQLLTEKGRDSYIVSPQFVSETHNMYKMGNWFDYKFHALMTRVTGKQAYFSKVATNKLIKYLKNVQPDIIHLHNIHGNFLNFNILMRYISRTNISLVITMHDCWYFTGKCFHYIESQCVKWQEECYDCIRRKCDIPSWFVDSSTKVYRDKNKWISKVEDVNIVGPSKWICDEAYKTFLKDKNIYCIYNGVDTSIFKPGIGIYRKRHHFDDKFIILGMADKWLDERNKKLVEAIINSLEKDDMILLVGTTEEMLNFETSKIFVIPYVTEREKLADIYRSANVFVNLTLADTFPTVNMEAICCGTPVVTHDVGGCAETVDEDTGMIVTIGENENIIRVIHEIKGRRFEKCAEKGQHRFSKRANYEKYIELYEQIMEKCYKDEKSTR